VAIAPPGCRAGAVALDGRAVGFAIAVTFLVGATVSSLCLRWRIARTDQATALKSGRAAHPPRRSARRPRRRANRALRHVLVGAGC